MYILGIHLDPPFIHLAIIHKKRGKLEIHTLKTEFIQQLKQSNVKRLYITDFKGKVVSGLSAKDCLIRSLELKIANNDYVEEALTFQAEATSHLSDVLTVPLFNKKEKNPVKALLFTVPHDSLSSHLTELAILQIDPDRVSTIPLGITHFLRWKFPDLLDAFVIHLGSDETTCLSIEKGKLKKTHAISVGIELLLEALLNDQKRILLKKDVEGAAKQIDLLLLKPALNPHLAAYLNELHTEVSKVFSSFHRGIEKTPVILMGRTDAFLNFREFIISEPTVHHWTLNGEEEKFGPSIGLALEQISEDPLQLRRGEFFPKKNWEKMGFQALILLIISIFLSSMLLIFSSFHVESQKQKMLSSLKISLKKPSSEKIEQWISSVEKNNKEYPYILQAPNVSEVLDWLSLHPLLQDLKKEGDPIDLKEVRYQLVHFPKIGSLKDSYQAKIEMEFTFKNATNARKFHDALRGDDKIDTNLDITWDVLSSGYAISFFLKNRSAI